MENSRSKKIYSDHPYRAIFDHRCSPEEIFGDMNVPGKLWVELRAQKYKKECKMEDLKKDIEKIKNDIEIFKSIPPIFWDSSPGFWEEIVVIHKRKKIIEKAQEAFCLFLDRNKEDHEYSWYKEQREKLRKLYDLAHRLEILNDRILDSKERVKKGKASGSLAHDPYTEKEAHEVESKLINKIKEYNIEYNEKYEIKI